MRNREEKRREIFYLKFGLFLTKEPSKVVGVSSSNFLLSDLSMAFLNGFHSAFSSARTILNDGTVLAI